MSGYKRVNFYELCRLCATNQQKEKTHIFQEEGRKIQLQSKIQTCLSLKVCENDFLPKVVCSQCLRSLEESCVFRKECYLSETMLSSYFNNFRYTEDFKKSGKVYIKDTGSKNVSTQDLSVQTSTVTTTTSVSNSNMSYNINIVPTQENVPCYTLNLPPVISNQTQEAKAANVGRKLTTTQPQVLYNLSTVKSNANEALNGFALNSNGEIVGIAPLIEIDAALAQHGPQKPSKRVPPKRGDGKDSLDNGEIVKIDLTRAEQYEKLNKLAYTIKLDESSKGRLVLNPLETNFNQNMFNGQSVLRANPKTTKTYAAYNTNDLVTSSISIVNPGSISSIGNLSVNSVAAPNANTFPTKSHNLNSEPVHNESASVANIVAASVANQSLCYSSNVQATEYSNTFNGITKSLSDSAAKQETLMKKHVCDICRKTFKRREHLYQHLKLHTGFRPFKCENCNKSFVRKEHLLRHMTSHSGQKNFTCNICEKSFSRNDNLLKHKKIHTKQNSFMCDVCQKQFVMEHYYLAHKLTHEDEKCNGNINQMWSLLKAV